VPLGSVDLHFHARHPRGQAKARIDDLYPLFLECCADAARRPELQARLAEIFGMYRGAVARLVKAGFSGILERRARRRTTGAVTRLLDRLERAGYARPVRDPGDRRRALVELTESRIGARRSSTGRSAKPARPGSSATPPTSWRCCATSSAAAARSMKSAPLKSAAGRGTESSWIDRSASGVHLLP
jgi:hypothetical protein